MASKPALTGHRNATRKRGQEAHKRRAEPVEFVTGLAEICNPHVEDKEQCFKLIQAQNFDFVTYGETFWEALLTGGILSAGGTMEALAVKCDLNVFESPYDEVDAISRLADQVLQRHRHLREVLDTVLCRITLWIDRYDPDTQRKMAKFIVNHALAHGAGLQTVAKLQQEKRLVEGGEAMTFCSMVFKEFLSKATIEKLNRALKEGKAQSIITLISSAKRTPSNLYNALEAEDLAGLAKWMRTHTREKRCDEVQDRLDEELGDIHSLEETSTRITLLQSQYVLTDKDIVVCVFRAIMTHADLSTKKSRAKEMTAHVVNFTELLVPYCKSQAAEKELLEALLNYVQDDETLFDAFMITCKELYDADVLGEDTILEWVEHKRAQGDPDMEPYLEQMQPFVEWLDEAEESSEEDED